ncbi:ATP-binding protein [Nocardioides sp.]|uniref:ATP-binding protein n=1 Tax=Nocardioides sp. TaxID=35761 RepID=UPI0031FE684F
MGHLTRLGLALRSARDVDEIATALLTDLHGLPGVRRVGLALAEGGGRRLRFVTTDRLEAGPLEWCHIDAYEDVPLTTVVRTGEPLLGSLDDFTARYAGVVERHRKQSIVALAVIPLPGTGSPIGGLILFFDEPQSFELAQVRLFEATARGTADAVRRVRLTRGRHGADSVPEEPDIAASALSVSILLEGDPRASSAARRFLRGKLVEWDVGEDVSDNALLCLSELVTNAVIHAGTSSELRATLEEGALTVVVRDLGGLGPNETDDAEPAADLDPLRVYGRGLMLVEALSDRWGSERDATGTTVWFALELDGPRETTEKTG